MPICQGLALIAENISELFDNWLAWISLPNTIGRDTKSRLETSEDIDIVTSSSRVNVLLSKH
jgi:hypothetical protein